MRVEAGPRPRRGCRAPRSTTFLSGASRRGLRRGWAVGRPRAPPKAASGSGVLQRRLALGPPDAGSLQSRVALPVPLLFVPAAPPVLGLPLVAELACGGGGAACALEEHQRDDDPKICPRRRALSGASATCRMVGNPGRHVNRRLGVHGAPWTHACRCVARPRRPHGSRGCGRPYRRGSCAPGWGGRVNASARSGGSGRSSPSFRTVPGPAGIERGAI